MAAEPSWPVDAPTAELSEATREAATAARSVALLQSKEATIEAPTAVHCAVVLPKLELADGPDDAVTPLPPDEEDEAKSEPIHEKTAAQTVTATTVSTTAVTTAGQTVPSAVLLYVQLAVTPQMVGTAPHSAVLSSSEREVRFERLLI